MEILKYFWKKWPIMQVLKFIGGKRGGVIARLPSGKVALVNRKARVSPRPGEMWVCKVDFEKERFAVVTPLHRIVRKTKTIRVYDEYKCGHRVLRRVDKEEVEIPEDEPVLPEVRVWQVQGLCPKCQRKLQETCKHEEYEVKIWPFGFIIRCKRCDKILYNLWNRRERNLFDLTTQEVREIEQEIREIKEQEVREAAEKAFRDYLNYVEEYNRMIEKAEQLKEQIEQILHKMAEILGAKDVKIEDNKVLAWFGEYRNIITGTIGAPSGKTYEYNYEPLYRRVQPTPELNELLCKHKELTEKRQEVEHWLTVNRPSE